MPPVPVVVDVWTVPAPQRRSDVPGTRVDRAVPDPAALDPAVPDAAALDPAVLDLAVPDPAVPDPAVLDPAVLDPAERARAASLPPDAGARFVLGRVLLRHALSARLGCSPAEVALRAVCPRCGGPHGRVLVGAAAGTVPLHVSVTRSGPVVAVAVCAGAAVGIDAESTSAVGAAPLAGVALSPHERVRLARGWRRALGARGADPVPTRALARTWVRKEAALKALGTGLDVDPAAVEVRRPPVRAQGVDAAVVGSGPADPRVRGALVAVADLRLGRGRVGAVAVVAPGLVGRAEPWTVGAATSRLVVRRYDGVSALSGRSS